MFALVASTLSYSPSIAPMPTPTSRLAAARFSPVVMAEPDVRFLTFILFSSALLLLTLSSSLAIAV